MEVSDQLYAPIVLPSETSPLTHLIAERVGARASLDIVLAGNRISIRRLSKP